MFQALSLDVVEWIELCACTFHIYNSLFCFVFFSIPFFLFISFVFFLRSFLVGDKIQITKHENFRVLSGVSESTIVVATNYKIQNQNYKFPVFYFVFCTTTRNNLLFVSFFC